MYYRGTTEWGSYIFLICSKRIRTHTLETEAEKPRRRVGIADQKVFARPESFSECLKNWPQKQSGKIPDSLESFQAVEKNFQTVWKVSRQSKMFQESMDIFRTVWKVFEQPRKFPDSMESCRRVWKVSKQLKKFQYCQVG